VQCCFRVIHSRNILRTQSWVSVGALLCFMKPILGNRYRPGVSSKAVQRGLTPDWKSPKCLLALSPLKQPGVPRSSPFTSITSLAVPIPFFLLERSYNYYVDIQGLVPWRLRRLRWVWRSFGRIGEGPLWCQDFLRFKVPSSTKSFNTHHQNKAALACLKLTKGRWQWQNWPKMCYVIFLSQNVTFQVLGSSILDRNNPQCADA